MGPRDAVQRALAGYARFDGRSRRAEYWWFALAHVLVVTVPALLGWTLLALGLVLRGDVGWALVAVGAVVAGVGYLVSLALFVPYLAVTVRRLHDTGRGAVWLVLAFVPYASYALLWLCAEDGRPGPNEHGPDPKGRPPALPGPSPVWGPPAPWAPPRWGPPPAWAPPPPASTPPPGWRPPPGWVPPSQAGGRPL